MKTLLLTTALIAGALTPTGIPTVSMAATMHYCEGSNVYCEPFALNCTENNGRFTNLDAAPRRYVHYSCELPNSTSAVGAQSTDLFQQHGSAIGTTVVTADDDGRSDDNDDNNYNGGLETSPDVTGGSDTGTSGTVTAVVTGDDDSRSDDNGENNDSGSSGSSPDVTGGGDTGTVGGQFP